MTPRTRLLLAVLVFIVAGGAGLWAGTTLLAPSAPESRAELQQAVEATILPRDYARLPDVAVEAADGQRLRGALEGRWSLLFLGFSHCPDICPMTLQVLAAASEKLDNRDARPPRVAFVSVDPRRDTPADAQRYARAFDERFTGATGATAALGELADTLRVEFQVPDEPADSDYLVEHPSTVFLVDPRGRLRGLFSAPHDPEVMARDLQTIRRTWSQHDEQLPAT